MKKSILTLAIVALFFSNHTTQATSFSNEFETTPIVSRDAIIETFEWTVKTTQQNYSGTAHSLADAHKMIALVTHNEVILEKKIESYYQIKNQEKGANGKLYFWEAQTSSGHAKGFSNSEQQAKKMIELIGKGDVLNYKIIQSINY
ncbi:hypothetical protein [Flavobacterium sp. UMI-01]|uniref:hypothetical protein n=1 Tax=Flavobacterium sp. UMI-01 TaxID=1441053 RepID=UPI001C7D3D66|nr:hypothetical protein [Flavobacterium sp. UMI-01]GIZ09351.1 hypothetical protein FUMI01_20780 [Flavobacterium sp. UMI-01]